MYLLDFLGTFSLSRAEKLYYEKHYGKVKEEKTFDEWCEITGLKKPITN